MKEKKIEEDIKIEVIRSKKYYGQQMQHAPEKVKITHIPTGISVESEENSEPQIKKRDKCLRELKQLIIEKTKSWDYKD